MFNVSADASTTDSTVTDAGGDASMILSDAALGPLCPSSPPSVSSACLAFQSGIQCEYGEAYYEVCDVVLACDPTTLTWMSLYDGRNCPFGDGGTGCPSSFGNVNAGAVCPVDQADCDYPEGHCACTLGCGGPPPPPDAGIHWICRATPMGCPGPRPRLGKACAIEGQHCDYGLCCVATSLTCTAGYWHGVYKGGGCP